MKNKRCFNTKFKKSVFFLLPLLGLATCAYPDYSREDIRGQWEVTEGTGDQAQIFVGVVYNFGEDGVFFMKDKGTTEVGEYMITDSTLTLEFDEAGGQKARFTWHQEEDQIVWEHQRIDQTFYLEKAGEE